MTDIAVIDYGMGNLRSVAKALEHVAPDADICVTSEPAVIAAATRVVFPGQGAMPDCVRELDARGLRHAVLDAAANKPFLGICIGQQLLFEHSEEGDTAGLGLLPGRVMRFSRELMVDSQGQRLKVPHMGWSPVEQTIKHPLWHHIANSARFYFVHSYFVHADDESVLAALTDYPWAFASAVTKNNIFAVQFHPEKSQSAGLTLLENFVHWDGNNP